MKFLNKDSETVEHFNNYDELFEAAKDYFKEYGYNPSIHDESKSVDGGIVYAIHANEDSSFDHFFGFIAD